MEWGMFSKALGGIPVGALAGIVETLRPDGTKWRVRRRPDGVVERFKESGSAGLPLTIGWCMATGVLGCTLFLTTKLAPFEYVPFASFPAEAIGLKKGFLSHGITSFVAGFFLRGIKNILLGMLFGIGAGLEIGWAVRGMNGLLYGGRAFDYLQVPEEEEVDKTELSLVDIDYQALQYNAADAPPPVSHPPPPRSEPPPRSLSDLVPIEEGEAEWAAEDPPAEPVERKDAFAPTRRKLRPKFPSSD